jgi:hypothetical protein
MASDDGRKVTINSNQPGLIGDAHNFHQVQEETGVTSQNDTGQRLNPIFVTALMGLRKGWLDLTS